MKGDFTRSTFRKEKHYSSVRQQQGRVQLDADWNEQLDIQSHLDCTTRKDVIGSCGTPNSDSGFRITAPQDEAPSLYGVHFVHKTSGWAIGDKGTILATKDGGKNWEFQTVPKLLRNTNLCGVHFVSDAIGWVVGGCKIAPKQKKATILFTKDGGKTWASQKSGVNEVLAGVHFVDTLHGWAVGDKGTILATKDGGTKWSPQKSGANEVLAGVHFVDKSGWATGKKGIILATGDGGKKWGPQKSGVKQLLVGVHFVDALHGWVVGDKGTILTTKGGGTKWSPQKSGVTEALYGVHFVDALHGWAAGKKGTILATKDGGEKWNPQKSGVTEALHGIHFVDALHGWAAGKKGTILATKDGGENWSLLKPPLDLIIAPGRIYVDGILCELEEELSYLNQPDFPDAPPLEPNPGRTDLAYLDVWQHHITAVEDPDIQEVALGGPDTTTRTKTVWQVKIKENVGEVTCMDEIEEWPPPYSGGRLSTKVNSTADTEQPCDISPVGGYRGLENHLYRVEIHNSGNINDATFKWSRDNGSVVFAIEEFIDGQPTNKIKVKSLGRDEVFALSKGCWVEVLDDATELSEEPTGTLAEIIDYPDQTQRIITLSKQIDGYELNRHPKIRLWDQKCDAIPVKGENGSIALEGDGIEVKFSGNNFKTGDYWIFSARTFTDTSTGTIEELDNELPMGIEHHYCRLALLKWKNGNVAEIEDCRRQFPSLTELTNLFYVSGDGQEAMPDLTQPTALVPLSQPLQVGVANRTGAKVRFQIVKGNGQLQGSGNSIVVSTGIDGIASCNWELDSKTQSQLVEVFLLDKSGSPVPLPVRFTANLSVSSEVAYDPKNCKNLKNAKTVQTAIDQLCKLVGSPEPGIHIKHKTNKPLENDKTVTVDELTGGLRIECDQAIDPVSIKEPTCFVTLNIPAKPYNVNQLAGFHPLILNADLKVDDKIILWSPKPDAKNFLADLFSLLRGMKFQVDRVLGHVTLKGNCIWAMKDPKLYLDGDVFGQPRSNRTIELDLGKGSGDGQRGGDFTMWFWLVEKEEVILPHYMGQL